MYIILYNILHIGNAIKVINFNYEKLIKMIVWNLIKHYKYT